ncbi:MAG: ATP-dependent exonuclease SbcCD, C subunit-like protein [Spirochaetes bacterium]|nr:ATP-dependent exonuclease SbcCD, C subunit-like protein [Spirochaetota bacterium]MBN2769059.1 ATP-dependent exonuclease SbcCD, C subunit-like protein [Spirochaetota bacterium]
MIPELEFESDNSRAGFRLKTLELYNWGTFDKKVWSFSVDGENALVTGDIGSGKSTLVDAVTTLLVPSHRIAYNKAAGAESRERSLRSYVLGYYKHERSEAGYGTKSISLRTTGAYSVILAVFYNQGYSQSVTLAQVFYQKEPTGQPNRFYVVADRQLSIVEHFSDFGSDIKMLRKRLKNEQGIVEVCDTFPPYGAVFRRRFGLANEQALELFHQTVSMKSVGNLTDFVRGHMLEPFEIAPRIEMLIEHFDDLNRAHDAVRRARRQIDLLNPIITNLKIYNEQSQLKNDYVRKRSGLRYYFTDIKRVLLENRIERLCREADSLSKSVVNGNSLREKRQLERDILKQDIAGKGGNRVEEIKQSIARLGRERDHKKNRAAEYQKLIKELDVEYPESEKMFYKIKDSISEKLTVIKNNEAEIQNNRVQLEVKLKELKDNKEYIEREIQSLEKRHSNISRRQVLIRDALCAVLGVTEDKLPFAGELIAVREPEKLWEGAIERLLHSFGLSLLVPEELYSSVCDWVDRENLRGRLVYFRVAGDFINLVEAPDSLSLRSKILVNPESVFSGWIENEISKRYNFVCCENAEQFRHHAYALSINGQVKRSGNHHEKDDRYDIHDRSRYILGWSNLKKIELLRMSKSDAEKKISDIELNILDLKRQQNNIDNQKRLMLVIDSYTDYEDINWKPLVVEIADYQNQLEEFTSSSDVLASLQKDLGLLEKKMRDEESKLDSLKSDLARNDEKQKQCELLAQECRVQLETDNVFRVAPEELQEFVEEISDNKKITIESVDRLEQKVRELIQSKIDNIEKKIKRLSENIIKDMHDFCREYPAETVETDASIDAGPEYNRILENLLADDLPRFEKKFKELLNENTIREIANFQSQLNRECQDIKERIERINLSLAGIEYNRDRYIQLEALTNSDTEIRDFQHDLKDCTEGALAVNFDEQESEKRFGKVKDIIEKFRGRDDKSDQDKRWTRKVTDVRNWFVFAASERWKEDDSEYEHYTDSGGKSGGQKEKLAYTVLAASLAYQFGLEWGEVRSRSFRFVVIDEAFGRGSDESARYALELFRRLDLQLLIVTPLQKIRIIEPYVSRLGFVSNPEGRESVLREITIEEYQKEKSEKQS